VNGTATVTLSELYTAPLNWMAGYDSRNRLTSLLRFGASTNYSYDANSNRLTAVDSVSSDTDLDGVFDTDDFTQATSQTPNVDAGSNKLLGFTQTVTKTQAGKTKSVVTTPISYALDANGAMTSDGLRTFEYDATRRLSKVRLFKDGEAARLSYLHNALGQRVFKSEVTAEQTLPNESTLGLSFIDWLKKNFQWMFVAAQASTSVGTAFVYDEDGSLLGEYDNGSAAGKGRQEYIWLPTDSGQAIPIGIYKGGRFYAVHADHLGTPRLITDDANKPVWQWPYSAFGNNKPTGVLKATLNPKAAITNQPVLLKATAPAIEANLRFPGQYFDEESNLNYNYFRSYSAAQGRYSQPDPIGLDGGVSRFAYVMNLPLNFVDPRGLWSIAFEGYAGLGGGFNVSCSDGKLEITSRVGAGKGGGFSFDPRGTVSPHATGDAGAIARSYLTAGAEVSIPTLSVGASGTWRSGNAITTKTGGDYFELSLPQFGLGNWRTKFGRMAALGVEFGGYVNLGGLCSCKSN
jgi:RHS repeat-associated protein